ncbi:hypothetical protein ID47_10875 [Candidatus Paracaedibacter acanthamoebae]|uniref:Uncharacterized protein n=2 Tax=Candidatus Odyssella acanthamoebae TaxID=91604 RepID=A0A077AYN7_9PROT|nr:hypothetical protein ID47_10875 [Candidatus Paracaedibacter acanthamoebae]
MKNKLNLFILSVSLLTAGLSHLSDCYAADVLPSGTREVSERKTLEAFQVSVNNFNQFYAYQASQCSELRELESMGNHTQRVENIFNNNDTYLKENEDENTIYFRFLLAYIREGVKWAYAANGPIDQECEAAEEYNFNAVSALEYREESFIEAPMPIFTLFEKLDPITRKILNYLNQH